MKQKPCKDIDFNTIKIAENQYFIINVPIYECKIEVIISKLALEKRIKANPTSEVFKAIEKDYTDEGTYGVTYNFSPNMILYINRGENIFSFFNTLSHEIRHLVDYILYSTSVEHISGNNNEAYAYLTGYITEEIMKKIKFVNNC